MIIHKQFSLSRNICLLLVLSSRTSSSHSNNSSSSVFSFSSRQFFSPPVGDLRRGRTRPERSAKLYEVRTSRSRTWPIPASPSLSSSSSSINILTVLVSEQRARCFGQETLRFVHQRHLHTPVGRLPGVEVGVNLSVGDQVLGYVSPGGVEGQT